VGQFPPNAFGLYDLHGNVYEWCHDRFDEGYYRRSPRRNPRGSGRGAQRVLRSAGYSDSGHTCRAAARYYGTPDDRHDCLGFRVVCEWKR
jgi:formylglycine-generating enzyme required for sulfatase activity